MLTEVLFEVGFRIFKKDETGILSSWWNVELRDWQGNCSLELKHRLWKWKCFDALTHLHWCVGTFERCHWVKSIGNVAPSGKRPGLEKNGSMILILKERKHDLTKFNTFGKWPGDVNGQMSWDGEESLTLWRIWKVKSKDLEESHKNPENPTTEWSFEGFEGYVKELLLRICPIKGEEWLP